jgi:hypothetical protein
MRRKGRAVGAVLWAFRATARYVALFERAVMFALDEPSATITERVRETIED